ncbi:MAG: peptide ABC transporter substrate-binding protein [Rhodospirillaceae bacterium]|nr:peptide ABC transporter substrate-binding protein [Rhodospirillaceae bacterium]|tara:strand:+ start:3832 stop:5799 length:1968 start_codon:yes stop_codon:yes gene_type:complete
MKSEIITGYYQMFNCEESKNSNLLKSRVFIKYSMIVALIILIPMKLQAEKYIESEYFIQRVENNTLPSIQDRLPRKPRVINVKEPGKNGGEIRMFIGRAKDIRLMVVYGYSRLVGYNINRELIPDILEKFEIEDNKKFTLYLRKGHKWSDGADFTSEDFRYWWQDVANNKKLSPSGPPNDMIQNNEPPIFRIIDKYTVQYEWKNPKVSFLNRLASASPLFIYRPAHYLKQFHIKYTSEEKIKKNNKSKRNWAAIHNKKDNLYKFDNPDLPTLQPWFNSTRPPATRYIFKKNPYFHRVDQNGRQLPYLNQVKFSQVSASLIAAKAGAGESDLQARNISLKSFPFLKKNEIKLGDDSKYKTYLWKGAKGSHIALFPNLNVNNEILKKLFRDVRFRRALSLSIDRELVNEALYFGLASESNNTVLQESELYKEKYKTSWTQYDTDKANDLLDEIGTINKDSDGFRIMENGKRLEIIVETSGESEEETDVLELIKESWEEIGIKLFSKPSQRDVLRNRIFSGETMMAVWSGLENGIPTRNFEPRELAVTSQQQFQWPKWGQYIETRGLSGEKVELKEVQLLNELLVKWQNTSDQKLRKRIWQDMLDIHAEQVYTIGIVSGVKQPIVVKKNLKNVPKDGIYNWDPGAHFGIYMPDTFWLE